MLHTASTLKLLGIFLFILSITSCNEETIEPLGEGGISGVVLSSDTGKGLAAVRITTNPATTAIVTDADGKFVINSIPTGNYSITARRSSFRTETVNIAVKYGESTPVTILMEQSKEGNSAPNPASEPVPATDAQNQPISVTLRWRGSDPDKTDVLTYDVLLFESGDIQKKKVAEAIQDTSVVVTELKYNTTYFWQVITKDDRGNATNSEVWSFKTAALPEARYLFVRELGGNYDIYSSDGTEANTFRLTSNFSRELWPRLNPQRDIIAYSSNAGLEPQIFTMNRDGSNKRQVTMLPVVGYHNQGIGFTWAPDGGKVLYANYDNLYTINRDGSGLTLIAKAPNNRHFRTIDWTAQGNKIVVQTIGSNVNDSEIYIMNADGSGMSLLVANLPGRVESPSFSIDGKRVLYTVDASGFEVANGRQLDARIYIRNIETGEVTDLSAGKPAGTNDLYPRFSPDGAKVIFVNTSNDDISQRDIWMVNLSDGRSRVKLFSNADMPEWR